MQFDYAGQDLDATVTTKEGETEVEIADDDSVDDYDDDHDIWSPHSPFAMGCHADANSLQADDASALVQGLGFDLQTAKAAGFRVGYLGNETNPIVCISCRISRLGISEEAMSAWKVNGQQYLVCLIRYIGKYRRLDDIMQEDASLGKASAQFLVDLCDSYKPSIQSAHAALNDHLGIHDGQSNDDRSENLQGQAGARDIIRSFISKPLNFLMKERFVKILRYRHKYNLSWLGAEAFFNDTQGKASGHTYPSDPSYYMEEEQTATALPEFVIADHFSDSKGTETSFPLIAMQFAVRHFVRCTEFCLVCHCKTNNAFETLKPYVCSKNLCLFQYMALGFGPSLEWEILSQPTVVDLLISFTYLSAKHNRLKDFPVGLGFFVPLGINKYVHKGNPPSSEVENMHFLQPQNPTPTEGQGHYAKLNGATMELLFPKDTERRLWVGDWITICRYGQIKTQVHCRVNDVSFWPTVHLGPPVSASGESLKNPTGSFENVMFFIYDKNFDELNEFDRRSSICSLIETLPSVSEMRSYLSTFSSSSQPNLSNWKDRIPKSALDVLRWIVASNRSCIIQDDPEDASGLTNTASVEADSNAVGMSEDRVGGVGGYLQFRFAQGAPDKEHRFVQAVDKSSTNPGYPTIFAWHGSPLYNWHGILREGLHYKEVVHGRAYGNGVYMSLDFATSAGYAARYIQGGNWPRSRLDITSAISLNEVVNAPNQFVSRSPHLVVNQLDWIQTRYLFISARKTPAEAPRLRKQIPKTYYQQDPNLTACGPELSKLLIPMTVFSRRRRLALEINSAQFTAGNGSTTAISNGPLTFAPDGHVSDDTDEEDINILDKGFGYTAELGSPKSSVHSTLIPQTDYVPGKLESSKLPLLGPPEYATPAATKSLQRDLKMTLNVQDHSALHELGWYIDPNLISTVYQWIVEIHSFEASLPLASDLKQAGLTSIVLELRFSKDYPISPPFVRVIRPRFLSFQQGGGGHVTTGGALCMELLTNSGWSAVSSIESVLLQVRMALSSTEPRPARLEDGQNAARGTVRDYRVAEAVNAYIRACQMHGWEIPKDFSNHMGAVGWSARAN